MRNTFRSFENPNYRRYLAGQGTSLIGTWMQTVGQGWLVVNVLDGSGSQLGITLACQYLPLLVFAQLGGLIADRSDRRRLILWTQIAMGVIAAVLAVVTFTGVVRLWMVYALALALGLASMIDMPARHSFIAEIVGRDEVANAISLNSAVFNLARVLGPAAAAGVISVFGIGWCFLVNAVSFAAMATGLYRIDPSELHRSEPLPRGQGQIRAGARYVWTQPDLRLPLIILAIVGTLTMNSTVLLPLLARDDFGNRPGTLGALTAAMGIGAMAGALFAANRSRPTIPLLLGAGAVLGVSWLGVGAAPNLVVALPMLVVSGMGHIVYLNTTSALLQSQADPEMRGRVTSFYSQLFLGSTAIGGPIVGWMADRYGARTGATLAGAAAVCTVAAVLVVRRSRWVQERQCVSR